MGDPCWTSRHDWLESIHGWGTPAYWDAVFPEGHDYDESTDGICMLEEGHAVDHVFTPLGEIVISFAPAHPARRRGG